MVCHKHNRNEKNEKSIVNRYIEGFSGKGYLAIKGRISLFSQLFVGENLLHSDFVGEGLLLYKHYYREKDAYEKRHYATLVP